jgi:hypothetical protein
MKRELSVQKVSTIYCYSVAAGLGILPVIFGPMQVVADDGVESQVIVYGRSLGYSLDTSDQSKDVCVKNNPMIPLLRCGHLLNGRPQLLNGTGAWSAPGAPKQPKVGVSRSVAATTGVLDVPGNKKVIPFALMVSPGLTADQKNNRQLVVTDSGVSEYLLPKALGERDLAKFTLKEASRFDAHYDPTAGICRKAVSLQSPLDLRWNGVPNLDWIPQIGNASPGSEDPSFSGSRSLGNSPEVRAEVATALKQVVDLTVTPLKLSKRLMGQIQAVQTQRETWSASRDRADESEDRIRSQIAFKNKSRTSRFLYRDSEGRVLETPQGVGKSAYLAYYASGAPLPSDYPPGDSAPESESTPWSSMSRDARLARESSDADYRKLTDLQNELAGAVPGVDPDLAGFDLAKLEAAAFGALLCGKEIHAAIHTTQDPLEKKALTDLRDSLRQLLVRLGVRSQSTPASGGSNPGASGSSGSAGSAGQL